MAIEIRFDAERVAHYRAAGYRRDDTLSDWRAAHARGASVFTGTLNDPEATRARGSW